MTSERQTKGSLSEKTELAKVKNINSAKKLVFHYFHPNEKYIWRSFL